MKRLQVAVRGRWWLGLMLWATLPSLAWSQESASLSGLRPYNNFSGAFIDPSKWVGQWQCGSTVMECVREIQDRQLHLRVRGYGDPNANGGNQFGVSELYLKSGEAVTNLAAQVTVQRATADGCPTSAGGEGVGSAFLFGAFFNGGDGTYVDDVVAFLQMDHGASDPPGVLRVGGFMGSRYQTWPGSVFLGRVNVGERVFLNLAWDQPNHRFIARLFKPASNTFVEQYMPYSVPDSLPAAAPARRTLSARVQPVNCLGQRTSTEMEVLFDNVMTN
jgi:hypothetical protein